MMTSSSAADDVTDDVSNLASFRHYFPTQQLVAHASTMVSAVHRKASQTANEVAQSVCSILISTISHKFSLVLSPQVTQFRFKLDIVDETTNRQLNRVWSILHTI